MDGQDVQDLLRRIHPGYLVYPCSSSCRFSSALQRPTDCQPGTTSIRLHAIQYESDWPSNTMHQLTRAVALICFESTHQARRVLDANAFRIRVCGFLGCVQLPASGVVC
jgi:hypothetical protein